MYKEVYEMDKKMIPYEKMSKKQKKEMDRKKRNTWNGFNPVTRKPENPKAYKRRQAHEWDDTDSCACFFM